MTSTPRIVRAAARALANESDYESKTPDQTRQRTVDAIKVALRARAESRRRRRRLVPILAGVGFAAVAAAIVAVAVRSPRDAHDAKNVAPTSNVPVAAPTADSVTGTVAIVSPTGARSSLERGAAVSKGDRIVSNEGTANITLPSGSRIELERATDLRVDVGSGAQVVELTRGAVTSRVAKVAANDRFLVRSDDVEIEVRGTVFRVEHTSTSACPSITKVSVTEGRVVVRSQAGESVLGVGDAWESTCREAAAPTPSAGVSVAAPAKSANVHAASSAPVPSAQPSAEPSPVSDLSAQNALFRDAMATSSRGDNAGAIAQLDTFLQKYPNSPLHEGAAAQRMRLLAKTDPSSGAAAANDYLARYPNGFARAEAERIAARSDQNQNQK